MNNLFTRMSERLGQETMWALQGAGIVVLILTAILLLISIVPRPPVRVVLTSDKWTCTKAISDGIYAVCSEYQRTK